MDNIKAAALVARALAGGAVSQRHEVLEVLSHLDTCLTSIPASSTVARCPAAGEPSGEDGHPEAARACVGITAEHRPRRIEVLELDPPIGREGVQSLVSQKTRVELLRRVEILGVLKSGAAAARGLAVVEDAKTEQWLPHPVFLEQPTPDVMASR